MIHFAKHQPTSIAEITFAKSAVQCDLLEYESGRATNSILLHGIYGTGKTTIARAIANQRMAGYEVLEYNAKSGEKLNLAEWRNQTNWMVLNDISVVFIVEEVDFASNSTQSELAYFNDEIKAYNGMLIFTTNNKRNVDKSLLNRCNDFHIKPLTPAQALPRAKHILVSESIVESDAWLLRMLETAVASNSTASDWRSYGKVLDRIIRNHTNRSIKPPPKLRLV